jgi:hypothetical protein
MSIAFYLMTRRWNRAGVRASEAFNRISSREDFITTFRDMPCFARLVSQPQTMTGKAWGFDESGNDVTAGSQLPAAHQYHCLREDLEHDDSRAPPSSRPPGESSLAVAR